ncbi:hypothetical protein PoB_007437700 [Plakobranchus ocellatus]|uniref:Uncharacterized protein n=1 Tax=Plakobranchus ocellatus TaxID=259542 RepID=A0AAV4DV26_9GAST|nr:hypothetical protein PoB_007437700 [Plakobranchus ocellatus]
MAADTSSGPRDLKRQPNKARAPYRPLTAAVVHTPRPTHADDHQTIMTNKINSRSPGVYHKLALDTHSRHKPSLAIINALRKPVTY